MKEKLSDAIESGDELRILIATRDLVASQLEDTESGRDVASLSKQIQELTTKISTLERAKGKRNRLSPLEAARKAVRNE